MTDADAMSSHWGLPPWRRAAGLPARAAPERCEVVVVGGGVTGLATALELARRGVDVAVLEAGRVGDGASGRSGGIALEGTSAGELPGADDCLPALRGVLDRERIDCGLRLDGCWELAHGSAGSPLWEDGASELRVSATVAGGTLDPGALVRGLARAAHDRGTRVCELARVRAVRPHEVLVEGGRVRAERVVIALNAYATRLIAAREPLREALTLAVRTSPVARERREAAGLGAGQPFYTVDLPYLWGRSLPGGGLVFGAGLAPERPVALEGRSVDAPEVAARLDALEERVAKLHPALAGVRFEGRWAGPVAFRAARVPFLTEVAGAPSVIAAGAYAGHGLALGVRAARHVARAILDGGPLPEWGRADLELRGERAESDPVRLN